MRPAGLAFVAALAAITAPAQAAAQPTEQTFKHAGVTRSYLAYAPSASPARGAHRPVLIVLHGGGGNARQIMRFARFNPIAEREGFVVLYPQGLQHSWNDGRKFSGRNVQRDDVGFILAALDHLEAQGVGIDREAVGVAGISNGGFMAMRLGCEAAGKIAGIATLTATMPAETGARCHPARPVPVLMINGTSDPIVPYEGGYVRLLGRDRGAIWSTGRTVEFWMGVAHRATLQACDQDGWASATARQADLAVPMGVPTAEVAIAVPVARPDIVAVVGVVVAVVVRIIGRPDVDAAVRRLDGDLSGCCAVARGQCGRAHGSGKQKLTHVEYPFLLSLR